MRERTPIDRLRGSILRDQEQFYDAFAPVAAFPKTTLLQSWLRLSGQISANDKWRPAGFAVFAA